jgi:pimeloyl-ACP methyl ester carboxylesterase
MTFKPLFLIPVLFISAGVRAQTSSSPRTEERITLTTDDGWALNARYLPAADNAPTLVLIHSQKNDLNEWKLWFDYLKRYGYGYLAMDLRGHGNSFITPDGSTTTYKAFSVSGPNNEFNKMIRDVEAALAYLSTNSVTGASIILAGSVLGANLAIKTAAIHPEISMTAAFSPVLNVNDVLSVNPLRAYGKRPLLLVSGANRAKQYKELQLLNDIAKQACGRENITTMVEMKGFGAGELVTKYNIRRILDWFKNPRLPFIVDLSTASDLTDAPAPEAQTSPDETEQAPAEDADGYE